MPDRGHSETAAGLSPPIRVVTLTVSSRLATGPSGDRAGEALAEFSAGLGGELIGHEIVADSRELIASRLRHWADAGGGELILTSGGTGFSPDDVTPEATAAVTERPAPGIAEAMRAASAPHTPHWLLSRATAGIRGRCLIINFPGSPKSIGECGAAIAAALPHAIELLRQAPTER